MKETAPFARPPGSSPDLSAFNGTNLSKAVKSGYMGLDDCKVLLYRNEPEGWIAELPAMEGCYALMSTREEALAELGRVFEMIAAE